MLRLCVLLYLHFGSARYALEAYNLEEDFGLLDNDYSSSDCNELANVVVHIRHFHYWLESNGSKNLLLVISFKIHLVNLFTSCRFSCNGMSRIRHGAQMQ